MATEIVRDKHHTIIGYIETTHFQLIGRDKQHRIVGYYRPGDNYTRDHQHSIVGTGNQLMSLITNAAG